MNIDNALARAQKLMLDPGFNQLVEAKAAQHSGKPQRGANANISALEAQAFGYTPQYNGSNQMAPQYQTQAPIQILQETQQPANQRNTKLPKNILESFSETPPLSGDDVTSVPQSYFGTAPQPQYATQPQYTAPQPQYTAPQPQYTPQPQYVGGVDYNIIRQIVREAIAENSKGILNESAGSTFRGMRIAEGSVIQFIDNKGNLFEGTLKLKKRAQK